MLLCACGTNKDNGEHLPPAVMQKILLDINMAEAYSITVKDAGHPGGTKNVDSLPHYYKDILAHYKITEAQLTQSLNWYKAHPDEMDTLYNNLGPVITKMQTELATHKEIKLP